MNSKRSSNSAKAYAIQLHTGFQSQYQSSTTSSSSSFSSGGATSTRQVVVTNHYIVSGIPTIRKIENKNINITINEFVTTNVFVQVPRRTSKRALATNSTPAVPSPATTTTAKLTVPKISKPPWAPPRSDSIIPTQTLVTTLSQIPDPPEQPTRSEYPLGTKTSKTTAAKSMREISKRNHSIEGAVTFHD